MKIFIGNVDDRTTQEELSTLFEKHGTVVSCAVMKQYAFVHMRSTESAQKAIDELNGLELHGKKMVVELSKPRPQNTWKIFVGNVSTACDVTELRTMFEAYGPVVECDVVKDFAFVHMERESDAREAIKELNGKNLKGKRINVELSKKVQKPANGSSHSSRSRRPHDIRDPPHNRADAYDRRRAAEAAYASYALRPPHERFADPTRFNSFDNRPRPPSPMYYQRDRSPLRRSPPRPAYSGTDASGLPSNFHQNSLVSSYGSQTPAAVASNYANQVPMASSYGAHSSVYGANLDAYGQRGTSMAGYGTQMSAVASSFVTPPATNPYVAQPATATTYATPAISNTYRPQTNSAYDASQFAGLGQQPAAYSTLPTAKVEPAAFERTRLSPPRTPGTERFPTDRRFSELPGYRNVADSQANYHQSPPKPQMDYRRPMESFSDYSLGDYFRSAPLPTGFQRRA